jgi:type IV secretory pathway VirB2 component (pilin)
MKEKKLLKKLKPDSSTALGLTLGLLLGLAITQPALAATDPWSTFLNLVTNWVVGNLGKFLALISILVGAVISLATHRFQPLVWSIIIGVVIGGSVGLAKLFFEAGGSAFGTSW